MNIRSIVENELIQDAESVWCLKSHKEFGYSDGRSSEKYLHNVLNEAKDLSTISDELEGYIKDWPSEYHLSRKRAQLLSGFSFDSSLTVLEVGCGCGAITRYLGENFKQVISVEGSIHRAHLASQRIKELDSVSIICAPFQQIRFSQKFDIIFCIGVFEYSASFIDADNPYDAALKYFSDMLTPNGILVIAIENQFGLKYFNSVREDHLGTRFEGLEGYHRGSQKVRTFGKAELALMLQKYFSYTKFYYPYPDYKLPQCVVSNEFLELSSSGELISQMRSRDYFGETKVLWDESAVALELSRNNMLDFFANSFLVIASRESISDNIFNQLAILYSSGRKSIFSTQTRLVTSDTGELYVEKNKLSKIDDSRQGLLTLVETNDPWMDGVSLQTELIIRALSVKNDLSEIFEPCKDWVAFLMSKSNLENGVYWIDGGFIDSIWSNTYLVNGECQIIDREWIWGKEIRMNVIVIRAIYDWLSRTKSNLFLSKTLSSRSGKSLIFYIASAIGVELTKKDFEEFIHIETEMAWIITGTNKKRRSLLIRWFLIDRSSLYFVRRLRSWLNNAYSRGMARISNMIK